MTKSLSKTRLAIMLITTLSLLNLVSLNVGAHHGWADFDRSKRVEVRGVIIESKYENPHCFVRVRMEQEEWAIELAAVPRMRRHGISAEMVKVGTPLTLIGHPHKKKAHEMKAVSITLDGKTYDLTL